MRYRTRFAGSPRARALDCASSTRTQSIDDVIGRSDLADRALFLTLPPIADRRRRVESQLRREFQVARPRILGSLPDAAAHGLRNVGHSTSPSVVKAELEPE
jgi:hypothetical protein